MTEPARRPRRHRSVFVKLVAIMLATAVSLSLLVGFFFTLIVNPELLRSINRLAEDYTRVLATTAPDLETARSLAERFDLQTRFEGPRGVWTTTPDLPSIDAVQGMTVRRSRGRDFYLVPAPAGGTYLFSWELRRRLYVTHDIMLALLLLFVSAVVLTAHTLLKRSLRPLRVLHEGVARLSEGQLDVVLPSRTRDEFGVLTDAFNHMVGQIRGMVRARDQLLLDVSHELRSPLTRMKVALALLPEGDKSRSIAADVVEMEAMITELLELERLREGRGLRVERQDLRPLLREVAQSFEARPPGVRVVSEGGEALLDVDGDKLRTVLRNLLENALKYSLPDSGPVEVSVSQTAEAFVIRVTDDGPGIPEADLGSLFEPFFRVDRSRSKNTGGYGLGLSICKRILEAHGGTIAVENQPGRGAAFTLGLPKPV